MDKNVATRKDIDEVIEIMKSFMTQVDDRFNRLELSVDELKQDIQKILNHIDSIEKDISINDDERAVIGMQLTRMHDWIEKAAAKVGVEFTH